MTVITEGNNLRDRMNIARYVAVLAGQFINESKTNISYIKEKTNNADLVTNIDIEAQDFIISELKSFFPNDCFWGEESKSELEKYINNCWIIDPIDGTMNFIKGLPLYCTSIAYVIDNDPVLGVIYIPLTNSTYWAVKGNGAYLNNKRISVSKTNCLSKSIIATGLTYELELRKVNNSLFNALFQECIDVRFYGSGAIHLALLAEGAIDLYFERGPYLYDIASGVVILREAGGEYFEIDGKKLTPQSRTILATNKQLTEEFLKNFKHTYTI